MSTDTTTPTPDLAPTPEPPELPEELWDARLEDACAAKRTIRVTTDEEEVVDAAIEALAPDPRIFHRGGALVDVVRDAAAELRGAVRPADAPRVRILPTPTLQERMASSADWIKLTRKDGEIQETACHPPSWAVGAVAARGLWPPLRPLEAVVETPVLRPDGTVLDQPGYDVATGLLYEPATEFPPVPKAPTLAEAKAAAAQLCEVTEDFPFKKEAHRAAWLSSLLTPLARFAFRGPAPLFLMDANIQGSGKGLLVDVTVIIVSGGKGVVVASAPDSEDEWRKRITAYAVEGARIVLIDNIVKRLESGTLAAALTATSWGDRILGVTASAGGAAGVPLVMTWFATGNNVQVGADVSRRTIHVRLESTHEDPDVREGFHHPELRPWVYQERARLLVCALTILRAYCVAGRPVMKLRPYGSFEGWSGLVRQAVVWLGLDDPCDTRKELSSLSDLDRANREALLSAWNACYPDGTAKLVGSVLKDIKDPTSAAFEELRSAIVEMCGGSGSDLPSSQRVGMKLRGLRGRAIGAEAFDCGIGHGGAAKWYVRNIETEPER